MEKIWRNDGDGVPFLKTKTTECWKQMKADDQQTFARRCNLSLVLSPESLHDF